MTRMEGLKRSHQDENKITQNTTNSPKKGNREEMKIWMIIANFTIIFYFLIYVMQSMHSITFPSLNHFPE